jgi:hypothetical protein
MTYLQKSLSVAVLVLLGAAAASAQTVAESYDRFFNMSQVAISPTKLPRRSFRVSIHRSMSRRSRYQARPTRTTGNSPRWTTSRSVEYASPISDAARFAPISLAGGLVLFGNAMRVECGMARRDLLS